MDTVRKAILGIGATIVFLAIVASLRSVKQGSEVTRRLISEIVSEPQRLEVEKSIEALLASIERRETEYSLARNAEQERVDQPVSDSEGSLGLVGDSTVEAWLGRVDDLSRYLSLNRSLRIPEMQFITVKDWLSVTKVGTLETEADYRLALAGLRIAGKSTASFHIRRALQAYQNEFDNELPNISKQLLQYAKDKLSSDILDRYEINQSGEIPGLSKKKNIGMVEKDEPVDPLFKSRIYFFTDKGFGYRMLDDVREHMKRVTAAIEHFEQEYKRDPESSTEIEPYIEKREDIDDLPSLFEAMTTTALVGGTQ